MSDDLKPCPFCGESKRLWVASGSAQNQTGVFCSKCGTLGPASWGHDDNAPSAVAAWNRREGLEPTLRDHIDIVFDGPPGPQCGRFVEVEDAEGKSVNVGEWVERTDGYWALRIKPKWKTDNSTTRPTRD